MMTPWIERGETIRVFCTIYCLETKKPSTGGLCWKWISCITIS